MPSRGTRSQTSCHATSLRNQAESTDPWLDSDGLRKVTTHPHGLSISKLAGVLRLRRAFATRKPPLAQDDMKSAQPRDAFLPYPKSRPGAACRVRA
jgi:hypothetical protein